MLINGDPLQFISALSQEDKAKFDALFKPEIERVAVASKLPNEWQLRPYQKKIWDYLENGGKRACLIWHRRSGKDDIALNWAAKAAHLRIGEYWHMLPEASQGRKAIWEAVSPHTGKRRIDQAFPKNMRAQTRDNDMVIRFNNGSLWRIVGSDNYESLLGSTPVGIVFSEWALADPNAFGFLRPILAENNGWVVFITTPRGTNHAWRTYNGFKEDADAFSQVLTVDETGIFTKTELERELKEYIRDYGEEEGKALFYQEYYCSFEAALSGSYYGSYLNRAQRDNRIGKVEVDRSVLVHTSWDLGISDATAIWFIQTVGKERRLIDYHENSGCGLDEYARVLEAKQKQFGWVYGRHYFPHDIEYRELGNKGLSRVDTLQALGIKATVVPAHNVNDGINAVRRLLDVAYIDAKRCERGLDCLRNYRRAWNEKMKTFQDAPLHDWASHGSDALRTFASGFRDPKERPATNGLKSIKPTMNWPAERGTGWMGKF